MTIPALPTCNDDQIWRVWLSAFHAPSLAIADEIGVFRALSSEPCSTSRLAERLGLEHRAVEALVGLMASLEFVVRVNEVFHLTEVSRQYLVPESPYYWGGFLKRIREIPIDCTKLIEGLRKNTAATDARVTELWETPKPSPERLRGFTHAMHSHSFALANRVVGCFELEKVKTFLDVAGGSGSFSIAAANRHPDLRCSLMDLPPVCEVAREYIDKLSDGRRVETLAADMFAQPWLTGFERVFFSDIFHDWDDARCEALAEKALKSLAPSGRVMVHEMLLADTKDGPVNSAAYSMVMVFVTQGRQRSAKELMTMLTRVGFKDVRCRATASGYALVEGQKG